MYTRKLVDVRHAIPAIVMGLLATASSMPATAATGYAATAPTAESALAADQQLATAMRDNDSAGIENMLDDDWIVVASSGGIGEGKNVFPDGIKSGYLTRKTFELVDPRVRLYGNTALVTSKVKLSGVFGGKPFDIMERQTDVLVWKDGSWKCVLTHETKFDTPAKSQA
ncbi:MAG TPA: nuclear transport factor 2 family protein [Gammaproteobacteria bacterium]|nr:nuclear transport factor 2 family protein [Gammaproteobacteria bacterium]